jgi:hypothetical protein
MRTQEEIVAMVESKKNEVLDFTNEVLVPYLDFEHAKPYLKPEVVAKEGAEAEWNSTLEENLKTAMNDFREYAGFAWDKARDHRGLSAGRSVDKLTAWAWFFGKDDVVNRASAASHRNYGCPKLKIICEAFDFPIPSDPAIDNMMNGRPCFPDCQSGCGR